MKKRTKILTPEEQIAILHDSLRSLKSRCASLERKVKRLEAKDHAHEAEIEIARLERIAHDLADRWEEAEIEVLQLRQQLKGEAA